MKSLLASVLAVAIAVLLLGPVTVGEYLAEAAVKPEEGKHKVAVVGIVRFDGPAPKRKPVQMAVGDGTGSQCHHLHKTTLLDERSIIGDAGEIANVFIYVKKGLERKAYPVPKTPAVLNQNKCMFRPRVQGIRVGQTFVMKNSDPLIHNVRSLSSRNRPFNIAQPAKSPDRTRVFKEAEGPIRLDCDFHPWMAAYVFVMDHPFFDVTDQKGRFSIGGLPPGNYTLAAWHETFGERQTQIVVGAEPARPSFTFKAALP